MNGLLRLGILAALALLLGCGGGGSSSTPPTIENPPPPVSFTISLDAASYSLAPGTSIAINVSLHGQNGFNGAPTVTLTGLPSGTSVSPSSQFVLSAAGQQLTLTASTSTAIGNYGLSFQAVSNTLNASTSAPLAVEAPASFNLVPSGQRVSVQIGGVPSPIYVVSTTGTGATDYTLQFSALGLPSGVTAAFTPNPAKADAQVTVTLLAAATAPPIQAATIYLQATRSIDGTDESIPLLIYVVPPPGQLSASRTEFVPTDDTPEAVIYDPVHNLVFASLPHLSSVVVISPVTHQIVKRIPVPEGQGMSLTPDGQSILVGSYTQQLVWIDTASLAIVRRSILPNASPLCTPCDPQFALMPTPAVTSTGKVLFLGTTPFFNGVLEWDPIAGTLTPLGNFPVGTPGLMARSSDGSKVFFSDNSTAGNVAIYDSNLGSITASKAFGNYGFAIAANPHGTQFALAVNSLATYLLDSNLNVLSALPVGGLTTGLVFNPDGGSLYVVSDEGILPVISTIDTKTFALLGTAPAFDVNRDYTTTPNEGMEVPMAVDSTGLVFGAADHGVVLDDSTFFQNFPAGVVSAPTFVLGATPAEGALDSPTSLSIATQFFTDLPDVWFGPQRAVTSSLNGAGQLLTTSPSSVNAGPVNLRIFDPDGTTATLPLGFTYGAYPIITGSFAAGPAGGAAMPLFGYGFSTDVSNALISVQIAGKSVSATRSSNVIPQDYPFPLQSIEAIIPSAAGSSGVQDISVTSPSGSDTVSKAFHYLTSVSDYPSTDEFRDVLYDRKRQWVYLSAGDHVDILDLNTNTFKSPISPPTLGGTRVLQGLAVSEDYTKLLVANSSDNSVAVINPDSPSISNAVQIFPTGTSFTTGPMQLAPTNLNSVFISGSGLYSLDLSTQIVSKNAGALQPGVVLVLGGSSLSSSKDGSSAFIVQGGSSGGPILTWTAASNTWIGQDTEAYLYDGAASGDGKVFSAVGTGVPEHISVQFSDPQSNLLGRAGTPDYLRSGYLQGQRLHDSGSLDYVPFPQGIDIFDVHHGDLRERILLTEQIVGQLLHAMAIDETGKRIFLITSTGITVLQMDSVPLSIGSVTPTSGVLGTPIQLRGSGFLQGASVSFNGVSSPITWVDSNTLQVSLPSLSPGPVQLIVANPDGQTYSLDAAFLAQ